MVDRESKAPKKIVVKKSVASASDASAPKKIIKPPRSNKVIPSPARRDDDDAPRERRQRSSDSSERRSYPSERGAFAPRGRSDDTRRDTRSSYNDRPSFRDRYEARGERDSYPRDNDRRSSFRDDGLELVIGRHAALATISTRPSAVVKAVIQNDKRDDFVVPQKVLGTLKKLLTFVSEGELEKIAGTIHHEGICLQVQPAKQPTYKEILVTLKKFPATRSSVVVILDGVSNPHNVGVILRNAAFFGVDAVFAVQEKENASVSAVTYRLAQGGVEFVPIVAVKSTEQVIADLGTIKYSVFSTVVTGGEDLFSTVPSTKVALILGAEKDGVSLVSKTHVSRNLTIPGSGKIESLNVAAASAVLLAWASN